MKPAELLKQLNRIGDIIDRMADPDIFVWKQRGDNGTKDEIHRAFLMK